MKILFTSTHVTSFIKQDLNLLQLHADVELLTTKGIGSLFSIAAAVRRNQMTFTWFASAYAAPLVFFARKMGRKSVIVIGGVDVADYPEIHYGLWTSWWKSILSGYAIRNADKILVVDPCLKREAMRLAQYGGENTEYVPTGYNAEEWFSSGEKEAFVLTVAGCTTAERLRAKGIDFLLSVAAGLPDIHFVMVGFTHDLLKQMNISPAENVEIVPFMDQGSLRNYYQRARVYCQPSYAEGLPNSLCEAMLCECVPVGTNVGGIPTAMSQIGTLVPYGDVEKMSRAIAAALRESTDVGRAARKHIASTFTLERRERSLVKILEGSSA